MGNEHEIPRAYPAAPPTEAGQLEAPEPSSSWPMVVGIIAIVCGAGGALLGIWGVLSPLFADFMTRLMPAPPGQAEFTELYSAWTVPVSLLSLVIAVLLLVAGVGLVKRRAWALKACRTWAVARILLVLVGSAIGYMMMDSTFEAMQQSARGAGPPPDMMKAFAMIVTCFGFAWSLALPVFMLIWFSRARIKAEAAGWK